MTTRQVEGRELEISHPDKVLFSEAGATKTDVVTYYTRVAGRMLPHLRGRPLVMQRFPDGEGGPGFVQKDVPDWFPDWVRTVPVDNVGGGTTTYVVCEDAATLAYLASQAVLTPHVWLSRVGALDNPDQLVVDLDPPDDEPDRLDAVRYAARRVGDLLDEAGLSAYVKSSGSKGLHVHAPLDRSTGFDGVRDLAQRLAGLVADEEPDALTTERSKDKRHGRVFLDIGRNAYGQHAAAAYALRALPEAPVAVPLDWSEALSSTFHPRRYTLENVFRRLARKSDPWAGMPRRAGSAARALRRLEEARGEG